jgi:hypothetical protein
LLEENMKKLLIALVATLAIAGCSRTEQGAVVGGATGAVIGGVATGDAGGAIVGGAVGAVAGALIGRATEPGRCYYRGRDGRRYIANCPDGY